MCYFFCVYYSDASSRVCNRFLLGRVEQLLDAAGREKKCNAISHVSLVDVKDFQLDTYGQFGISEKSVKLFRYLCLCFYFSGGQGGL